MNPYEQIENKAKEASSLDELAESLHVLLNGNYSVWEDGTLYNIKQLVARYKGLKIEIYPNEHPPPHFHVKCGDISVSFSIENCELLEGKLDGRRTGLIEWWHKRTKEKLIETWNNTRPSDCPVGPIVQ
jgi:hypothetical protein